MKKNICSLLITVIQLFVTKRIHVVYAVIQCNLLCDTAYHNIFIVMSAKKMLANSS